MSVDKKFIFLKSLNLYIISIITKLLLYLLLWPVEYTWRMKIIFFFGSKFLFSQYKITRIIYFVIIFIFILHLPSKLSSTRWLKDWPDWPPTILTWLLHTSKTMKVDGQFTVQKDPVGRETCKKEHTILFWRWFGWFQLSKSLLSFLYYQ